MLADLAALGARPEDLAGLAGAAAERNDEATPVWPENRRALALFLAAASCWRWQAIVGLGGGAVVWTGLDYVQLRTVHDLRGGRWTPRLFGDVQAMEAAALGVLNGRR